MSFNKLISTILCFVIFSTCFTNAVLAEQDNVKTSFALPGKNDGDYYNYKNNLTVKGSGNAITVMDDLVVVEEGEKIEIPFSVTEKSLYLLELSYNSKNSRSDIGVSLKIDGITYFNEMSDIILPRIWVDASQKRVDAYGNESAAEQVLFDGFVSEKIGDKDGIEPNPYVFELLGGLHTLTVEVTLGCLILNSIVFCPNNDVEKYESYISNIAGEDYNGEAILIEAENAVYKTSKSLIAKADTTDPSLSPSSATSSILNTIGFNSWNSYGQKLTWEFYVSESAYYKIAFKYKQSESINSTSYRRLCIDGEVPFAEAASIPFEYANKWQYTEFSNNGNPYKIYLEKGTHTISLSVTLSAISDFYRRLEKIVNSLGEDYINISMITGETPDKNRDYDLFKQIPELEKRIRANIDGLNSLSNDMNKLTEFSGNSMIAAFNNMLRVLKSMLDNPYTMQRYLNDYYSNYTSIGGWLYDMKSMPLSLDKIVFSSTNDTSENTITKVTERFIFGVKRFLASFSSKYNTLGTVGDGPQLKIWVNWGRDQAEVLGNMITEDFTPKTGINVKLEIVNAGIAKGILAGNPPDLALHMSRSEPVNLAMRGALYDLSQFDDFNEVTGRFADTAFIPYTYCNGIYALPDTQSFYVMYCRTDILNKLGLSIPTTWEEFIDNTIVIQRNNMQVWLPYLKVTTATTVNSGVGSLSIFPTLVKQNGLELYNSAKNGCTLYDRRIIDVFEMWTDFYTKYKIPKEISFYNRFRVGTIPLGIESYTIYQTIANAAPEIEDDWSIAEIPGTIDDAGNVNNCISGAGTGCGIIKDTGNEKYAWEFIKWWTSAEMQLKYSEGVETVLGTLGRVASANKDAVSQMSWKRHDINVIMSAWDKVDEVEEIPGSYYLSRAIDQAYWAVVNGTSAAQDALMAWGKFADNEIKRKIEDYE